jgi:uncharacterized protein YkwD
MSVLRRSLIAAVVVLAAFPGPGWGACRDENQAPSDVSAGRLRDALGCLVNQARTSRGLRAVRRDGRLTRIAGRYAHDMVRRRLFGHVSPSGQRLIDRMREGGYGRGRRFVAGEILAWGTRSLATPRALLSAWLASPPHREILLSREFDRLGMDVRFPAPFEQVSPGATAVAEFGHER